MVLRAFDLVYIIIKPATNMPTPYEIDEVLYNSLVEGVVYSYNRKFSLMISMVVSEFLIFYVMNVPRSFFR